MLLINRVKNNRININYLINLLYNQYNKIKYYYLYKSCNKHFNYNINYFNYKQYWQVQSTINLDINIFITILNKD